MPSHLTTLMDDFLGRYVMEFRASPALAGPVVSEHTPGYERTGNWSVGCRVTALGIYSSQGGICVSTFHLVHNIMYMYVLFCNK